MIIDYSSFLKSKVAKHANIKKYDWFCSKRKIKMELVSDKRSIVSQNRISYDYL